MDKLPTVGQKSSVKWKNLDYTIVDNSKEDTWVVCGPSGAYADACQYMGWCQSTQVLVVSFLMLGPSGITKHDSLNRLLNHLSQYLSGTTMRQQIKSLMN
jgi:hypothetical protein